MIMSCAHKNIIRKSVRNNKDTTHIYIYEGAIEAPLVHRSYGTTKDLGR